MLLFTDGGSTKCDWVGLNNQRQVVFTTTTSGLNPTVLTDSSLQEIIFSSNELIAVAKRVKKLDFYGAGCSGSVAQNRLKTVLKKTFTQAEIQVREDTYAAVYSVTTNTGIVCILGTGSNSVFYDGNCIHSAFPSLGYLIMDDGSGKYFGKQLLRDYYLGKMPNGIHQAFEKRYNLSVEEVKENLYKKEKPNAYLASFTHFLFSQPDEEAYFYHLINKGLSIFIQDYVLCYPQSREVPIHFVGSIAYFAKDMLLESLKNFNLQAGKIIQRPIDGLIEYYQKKSF